MDDILGSVGFPHNGTEEFARLFMQVQQEGEIITTSEGIYYFWAIPTEVDWDIEIWLKSGHDGKTSSIGPHFNGATSGVLELQAALRRPQGQHYDGGFRFDYFRFMERRAYVLKTPLVFDCPNFDCYADIIVPYKLDVQLCGIGARLDCYEDEADYRARSNSPPYTEEDGFEFLMASDYVTDGELNLETMSPVTYIAGRVDETQIVTNPVTGCDFIWSVLDLGNFGLIDVVAPPEGLRGFMHEGAIVRGTVILAGRILGEPDEATDAQAAQPAAETLVN